MFLQTLGYALLIPATIAAALLAATGIQIAYLKFSHRCTWREAARKWWRE